MMNISFACDCGKQYSVSSEHAGKAGKCTQCGAVLRVPEMSAGGLSAGETQRAQEQSAPVPSAEVCGYCLSAMAGEQPAAVYVCPGCGAAYHKDCWDENGGCGVYGCSYVPHLEPRDILEVPAAYWGKDQKPCPACGELVQAMAVRCRACGAVFASARPENAQEFQAHVTLKQQLPDLHRGVVLLLVFSVITCSAPIAAIVGVAWYISHRDALRSIPGPYAGLCVIGLGISVVQTMTIIVMTLVYALTQMI